MRTPTMLLVGAAVLTAAPAVADERDDRSMLPTIEVRDILPDRVDLAPGAAAVLTSAEIEQLRPYTLHDAFDFLPGVRALDDDVHGRRAGIGIRGSPTRRSRKVLLLEDGTPINASTYLDPSAHYTPPMERLERIDVLKASGQILHGPLNNHGIVNLRNKRPTLEPETSVEIAVGSLAASRQHVMHRRTDGALGSVIAYTRHGADGAFDVEDTELNDVYGALEWRLAPAHELVLSAAYLRERSHYDESNLTPQEFALAPRRKLGRFGQEHDTIAVDYRKTDVVHNFEPTEDWLVSTRAFFTDLDRPRFTVDPGEYDVAALPELVLAEGDGAFVPGVDGNGRMISRNRHYRTAGVESRVEHRGLRGERVEHTLQWGVRFEKHRFRDRRTQGAVGEVLHERNRGALVRDEPYEASARSAFVQDVVALGAWTVTPGVRAESYTQTKRRVFPTVQPRQRYDDTVVLPGVSVLYEGFEQVRLFGNLQRGYTPAIARGSDFPLIPEIGLNAQVGARGQAGAGLTFELAAFHNRLRDTLVQLPFVDPQTGANVFINAADSRATGADAGLRVESQPYTQGPRNFFAVLAYNYTRATFTEGPSRGNHVPEIPRQNGSLTVGLEHDGGWYVSATLSYQSRFFTDPANTRAPLLADEDGEPVGFGDVLDLREPIVLGAVPSRRLLSARAGYTFARLPATVWIQGRNLGDELYVSDYSNGLRPGAERTVTAGVSLRF